MKLKFLFCLLLPTVVFSSLSAKSRSDVSFVRDVAPVLLKRCSGCHGEKINLGGYRVSSFNYLMKKGASGQAAVTPGKPEGSTIFRLISTSLPSMRMPKGDDPLTTAHVLVIKKWISEGAKFDGTDPAASLRSAMGPRQHPAAPTIYRSAPPVLALSLISGSAAGAPVVAVGGYNEVTLWDASSGSLLRRIGDLPQRIQALSCSADGKYLLVAGGTPGEYGEASLVDLHSGGKPTVICTATDVLLTAVYSQDATRIGVGGADGAVSVFDASTLKKMWTSSLHSDWVTSISFSADGNFVASASRDMTVKLHNAADGSLYTTYSGHCKQLGQYKGQDPVYSVRFLSTGCDALSAGGGKWIQVWNAEKAKEDSGSAADMEERFAKQGHTRYLPHNSPLPVFALAMSGNSLFAASGDGAVREFDINGLKEVKTYTGHKDWVYSLDYNAGDHRLASGAFNGEVRIWNTDTGECTCRFVAQPGAITKKVTLR